MNKLRNMTSIFILNGNKILLLYRVGSKVFDSPKWCGIGGHFEKDELNDPYACVLRELGEETGITRTDINNLKLKYMALRIKGNELRQNYYFFAELDNQQIILPECNEGKLEWVNTDEILEKEMPSSAKCCLKHYFEGGKNDDKVYLGVTEGKTGQLISIGEFDSNIAEK